MTTYSVTSGLVFDLFHIIVRRALGGKNLWESKDDKTWGHDKFFEEITTQRNYEEVNGVGILVLYLCLKDLIL